MISLKSTAKTAGLPASVNKDLITLIGGLSNSYTFDLLSFDEITQSAFKKPEVEAEGFALSVGYTYENTPQQARLYLTRLYDDGNQDTRPLGDFARLWCEIPELSRYESDPNEAISKMDIKIKVSKNGNGIKIDALLVGDSPKPSTVPTAPTPVTTPKKPSGSQPELPSSSEEDWGRRVLHFCNELPKAWRQFLIEANSPVVYMESKNGELLPFLCGTSIENEVPEAWQKDSYVDTDLFLRMKSFSSFENEILIEF